MNVSQYKPLYIRSEVWQMLIDFQNYFHCRNLHEICNKLHAIIWSRVTLWTNDQHFILLRSIGVYGKTMNVTSHMTQSQRTDPCHSRWQWMWRHTWHNHSVLTCVIVDDNECDITHDTITLYWPVSQSMTMNVTSHMTQSQCTELCHSWWQWMWRHTRHNHSVLTCVIVEEVSQQTSWDCLMTYNKNVLLSLELHNDGLQTTDNVHVWLDTTVQHIPCVH